MAWNPSPWSQGLLGLGAGLLEAGAPSEQPVNLGMAINQGAQGFLGAFEAAKEQKRAERQAKLDSQYQRLQMQTARREQAAALRAEKQKQALIQDLFAKGQPAQQPGLGANLQGPPAPAQQAGLLSTLPPQEMAIAKMAALEGDTTALAGLLEPPEQGAPIRVENEGMVETYLPDPTTGQLKRIGKSPKWKPEEEEGFNLNENAARIGPNGEIIAAGPGYGQEDAEPPITKEFRDETPDGRQVIVTKQWNADTETWEPLAKAARFDEGEDETSPFTKVNPLDIPPGKRAAFQESGGDVRTLGGFTPEDPRAAREQRQSEEGLRQEFIGQSKDFVKQAEAYSKVQASAQDPSPAGDMSLIFGYMKMLDPGSTVREGEYAEVANSGSVSDRIIAAYNKARAGEKLSPNQRGDFLNRAGMLYETTLDKHQNLKKEYRGLAENYGIAPQNVVIDYTPDQAKGNVGIGKVKVAGGGGLLEEPQKGMAAQPPPDKVAKPMSKADYDALPSGTLFIDPEGVTRRKP